jgi:PAS domain S-box-containing protein
MAQRRNRPDRKTLRGRAEEELRTAATDVQDMTSEEVQRLVQELRIHQIELELQNEELRHAQVELAESRDRYSDLYDFAPVGYITLDKDDRIMESNLAAATMVGMDRQVLRGMNITRFIVREFQDDWYLHHHAVLAASTKQTCSIVLRRADGERLSVRLESAAFGSGEDRRCQTAIIDMTLQKRTEEKLEQLLCREQAARQEAEALSQAKDRFLAMVSHELRTPLTAVLGWSKLLLGKNIDISNHARAVESIERNAKVLTQLIEDLLNVPAMGVGKIHLQFQPVELVTIINTAIDVVRPEAATKAIQIQTQFDTNVGRCSGDPQRLQQSIYNLLSNALKFTPKGGRIDVRLQKRNSQIQIVVSDSGAGIRADFLPYVFDPFRQADTTTRRHGGLGLGLAIVRQIVELHGGTVHAESSGEGKGSTFFIQLPAAMFVAEKTRQQRTNEPGW